MTRKKQDWTPRADSERRRAMANWPKLKELARNHDGESRSLVSAILATPFKTDRDMALQLDDIRWLVEGDHQYEGLSYKADPLWRLATEMLRKFPGEE